jgi:hypothetical protein
LGEDALRGAGFGLLMVGWIAVVYALMPWKRGSVRDLRQWGFLALASSVAIAWSVTSGWWRRHRSSAGDRPRAD